MAIIVRMVLLGWIEPFLWYKSMSARYIPKNEKRCMAAFLIYGMLLITKSLVNNAIGNPFIQGITMIAIELYVILVTVLFFEGRLRDKLLSVFIFNCILIATELLVIKSYMFFVHTDLDAIFQNQMAYNMCGLMIAFVKSIVCYCYFGSSKITRLFHSFKERTVVILMVGIILSGLLVKSFLYEKQSDMSLLTDLVWFGFGMNAFSFAMVLKKKSNDIAELQQDISHSMERRELAENIERFQHSYEINMLIMKNMLCNQQYEVLGDYMEEAFAEVEKAVLLYNHSNPAIRILISRFIQIAMDMRIPFTVRILVNDFGMTDEDICSILQNLIKNGLETAAKVPYDIAFVTLQVLLTDDGYKIICSNSCIGKADFAQTSKRDKQNHGFGVGIVDKIVKKNSAIISRTCLETEHEGVGRVIISIRVFYKENCKIQLEEIG